jgi:Na+-transporting NADH:ubiquinone oxidoreductase subunit C
MKETPLRSMAVLLLVALFCSVLVSVSAIKLGPIQLQNEMLERYRNIAALTGLAPSGRTLTDAEVLDVVKQLDVRVVNLDTGMFAPDVAADSVDARSAVSDPETSTAIDPPDDLARIGRRPIHEVVYLVWRDGKLDRIILPIHGQGMWSTLYGFIALEADFDTIAAVTFYEQEETAGLGDQIERPDWQARWVGRHLFDNRGVVRFRVAAGPVPDGTLAAAHEVDGLSGATVTGDAVTNLVRFWFGPAGYGPLLERLADEPPSHSVAAR